MDCNGKQYFLILSLRDALKRKKFCLSGQIRFYFYIAISFVIAETTVLFHSINSVFQGPVNNFGAFLAFIASAYLIDDCKNLMHSFGNKILAIITKCLFILVVLISTAFLIINFLNVAAFSDFNKYPNFFWLQKFSTQLATFITNFSVSISLFLAFYYCDTLTGLISKRYRVYVGISSLILGIASFEAAIILISYIANIDYYTCFDLIAYAYISFHTNKYVKGEGFRMLWCYYLIKPVNYLRSILTTISVFTIEQTSNQMEMEEAQESESSNYLHQSLLNEAN